MTAALVTGAAGFMARHLAPALRRRGFDKIVGADVRPVSPGLFDECFAADLSLKPAMMDVLRRSAPACVFHLSGLARGSESEIRASNVDTARNLLECVRDASPSTSVVLIGSAAEYGEVPADRQPVDETFALKPLGPYGEAKAAVSALAAKAANDGLHVMVARPFNIIGPGVPDSLVVGALVDRLRRAVAAPPPRTIRVGTTTSTRDFIAVEDVVDGLVLASERGEPGAAYNLCTGVGRTISEVLNQLIALTREEVKVESDPSLVRRGETSALVGSWKKAQRDLGWSPRVPFDFSLRETWEASARPLEVPAR